MEIMLYFDKFQIYTENSRMCLHCYTMAFAGLENMTKIVYGLPTV